jgi:rod shape-determining protein MreC
MVVYRRDTRRRWVFIMVLATSLVLVTLDSRGSGVVDTFRSAARDVIAPVQDAVDTAFSPVRDLVNGVTSYGSVKDENEQLKREIADLRGRIRRERAVGSDVGELEKLLDLPTIEDATGVTARVIGGSPGNFERTVQLDRGSGAGIEVGQPVVAGDGLVGRVTEASSSRATVTLIDSPGFGVGVRLERSNERGIAEGRAGERDLRLNFLSNLRAEVEKGELCFTSAVETAAFPPDIPVAEVVEVQKQIGELEPEIAMRPIVNLDDLLYVKALRLPESGTSSGTEP